MKTIKLKDSVLIGVVFIVILSLFFLSRPAGRTDAVPEMFKRVGAEPEKKENKIIGKNSVSDAAVPVKKSEVKVAAAHQRKKRVSSLQEPGEAFGGGTH